MLSSASEAIRAGEREAKIGFEERNNYA